MKTPKPQFIALALTAIVIGCQGPPVEQGVDRIVGVKIYETDRELPGLFADWKELGVNTVFVARELVSKDEFHELAAKNDIDMAIALIKSFICVTNFEEPSV